MAHVASCLKYAVVALIGAGLAMSAAAQERLALIIAQADYDTSMGRLDSTYTDANILGTALTEVGFDVTDKRDLTKDEMRREILDFAGRLEDAGPDAVGMFYFTGHGAALSENSDNFLIPVDAPISRANDLVTEAYKLGDAVARLEVTGASHVFVVVDACRNVPFAAANKSAHKGFSVEQAKAGMLIAYATAPGTTAAADNLYSTALAQAVKTPGVEALPMFKSVRLAVLKATGGSQFPWTREAMTGDFYFGGNGEDAGDVEIVLASVAPTPAPPVDAGGDSGSVVIAGTKTPDVNEVTGYNLSEVFVPDQAGGFSVRFTQLPGGYWEEIALTPGGNSFVFEESARDEGSVYLKDPSRDVWLQLDVWRNTIFYRDPSLDAPRPQYLIGQANADPADARTPTLAIHSQQPVAPADALTIVTDTGRYAQISPSQWAEYDADGGEIAVYDLVQRGEWSVFLYDPARDLHVRPDLYLRKVMQRAGSAAEETPRGQGITGWNGETSAPTLPPEPAEPEQDVSALEATRILFDGGAFEARDGALWAELRADGSEAFSFEAYARDEWSVYLLDASRDVYLQLDMYQRQVLYRAGPEGEMAPLYTITGWE